jgi:hypothetical protein
MTLLWVPKVSSLIVSKAKLRCEAIQEVEEGDVDFKLENILCFFLLLPHATSFSGSFACSGVVG